MKKSDLVQIVIEKGKLKRKEAELAVQLIFDSIQEKLGKGEKVQILGFGNFETRQRNARMGRNPQTGEEVPVPEMRIPAFKAGKTLKKAVNG